MYWKKVPCYNQCLIHAIRFAVITKTCDEEDVLTNRKSLIWCPPAPIHMLNCDGILRYHSTLFRDCLCWRRKLHILLPTTIPSHYVRLQNTVTTIAS